MACIYADREGSCMMADRDDDDNLIASSNLPGGCSDDGFCVCEDDPDPSITCESYESDYTCPECGADLNNSDCECDEEE